MPPNNSDSPKRKPSRPLDLIQKKLSRVKKRVGRLDEDIYDIYQEFTELVNGPVSNHQPLTKAASILPTGTLSADSLALRRKAKEGVATLSLNFHPDRSGSLKIEGRERFPLPPRLAALTAGLTMDTGHSPDHLVSWKLDAEIITDLKKRTGKEYSRHAFNHLIHLLRATLKDHGENPWLVMRDPKLGSRFALRRGFGGVNGANHN